MSIAVKLRVVVAAAALVVAGAACSGGGEDGAGRLAVDGRAELQSSGGETREVKGTHTVMFGDRVKVLQGTATLRLAGNRQLELRSGTNIVLDEAKVGDGSEVRPRLLEQDLLVEAPADARLTVSTEGTDVIVAGAAKISRGPVLVVSTYQGAVELRSGDQSMTVPALREATVGAGGSLAGPLAALTYDAEDLWDRRFLSDSIELGRELEARSKGFSAQLGADEGRTVEFLLQLLPALGNQPDFTPALFAPGRAPGESLVGAAIALEGTRGTFGERWAGVFGFRDAGAQWGLVALDQGVGRVPVLGAVDAAIGRGPRAFETIPLPGPSTTPGEGVALPGPIGGGTGPGSTPTTVARPPSTQNPPVSVPTTAPPATTIGPLNTGIPALDAAVNALVETLTGLLRSLGGS